MFCAQKTFFLIPHDFPLCFVRHLFKIIIKCLSVFACVQLYIKSHGKATQKILSKNWFRKKALMDFSMRAFYNWARRIRTFGMTESESVALPLGDSPPTRNEYTRILKKKQELFENFFYKFKYFSFQVLSKVPLFASLLLFSDNSSILRCMNPQYIILFHLLIKLNK